MSLEKKIRNFIKGPRKGEAFELRSGLISQYKAERKDAIQRVIQAMTVGKDVLALFPDVLKNIATYDLEQKKLVYLYLMNYAKLHPELCILAVNTFVQDTEDPNPLVRALAIRTMGCIRVARIADYIEIPLRRTLLDDNPYVRKTAAICVAKLFDLNAEVCIEFGFLDLLKLLVNDSNPMVIANAINALYEIREMNTDALLDILTIDSKMVKSLLACLNECTEWGRITILTALTDYHAAGAEESTHIIERVIPQLQHANPSVVLSSIKAILHFVENLSDSTQRYQTLRKLLAPLVSLVSSSIPEAKYVGLKNIRIILEKYPQTLSKELRVFFIKYSDPLYLKLEKLEIMIRLANENNGNLLLGELKEYAMEFEPLLVSKAIKTIGSVGIQIPEFAVKAVNLLCHLIEARGGELVINELVAVLTNILRRYPRKNDLITLVIPVISASCEALDTNEAQCGYIWLLGEYPTYFQQLHVKLSSLVERFLEEDSSLQLQILNCVVKINLLAKDSQKYASLLQKVLEKATKECENADVRDKAYIYWRLLSSSSTDAQKSIVLGKLPPIKTTVSSFNPNILEELLGELSTLASVYHKPSRTFIDKGFASKKTKSQKGVTDLQNDAKKEIIKSLRNETLLDFGDDDDDSARNMGENSAGEPSLLDELNDLFNAPAPPVAPIQIGSTTDDILSFFNTPSSNSATETRGSGSVSSGVKDLSLDSTKEHKPMSDNWMDLI